MSGSSEGLAKLPRHFYLSGPRPCPYLFGRIERSIFTDLTSAEGDRLYETLLRGGFRRSHQVAFRPACPECQACVPVRVLTESFEERPWMRRILKLNAPLAVEVVPARASREQYALFRRYIATRHGDGEMALMDYDDYRNMIEDSPVRSFVLEFRDPLGVLVAACLADRLSEGFSAVYSFFAAGGKWPSLGSYMILHLILAAQQRSLPYVYLGYWVGGSRKMAYKARFRPLEALGSEGWRKFDPPQLRIM
ncbi:MAG TPA: arginyltransferase [Alphaproteobacteria bacterium]|nr:arginyltransferase [Alphaproteobacteria bacterium]